MVLLGRNTLQQILYPDIFIEIGPVNALSFPDEPPILPFVLAPVEKAGIPDNKHRHDTPVDEINDQCVFEHGDILSYRRAYSYQCLLL
jgi:hypothetical protein